MFALLPPAQVVQHVGKAAAVENPLPVRPELPHRYRRGSEAGSDMRLGSGRKFRIRPKSHRWCCPAQQNVRPIQNASLTSIGHRQDGLYQGGAKEYKVACVFLSQVSRQSVSPSLLQVLTTKLCRLPSHLSAKASATFLARLRHAMPATHSVRPRFALVSKQIFTECLNEP